MLTNTFYRNSSTQKTKEAQREATKASEGLKRVLELANRGEPVGDKTTQAIDYAIVKLGILKSRMVKFGQLGQVITELEKVVEEKNNDTRKRVDDIVREIGDVNTRLDVLLRQKEILDAQIVAANALRDEEDKGGNDEQDGEETSRGGYADASDVPSNRGDISDYCKGEWDDTIDDFEET